MNDIEIILGVQGLPKYQADMNKAAQSTTGATSKITDGLKSVATSLGLAFGGAAIVSFLKNSAKSAIAFETLNVQFGVFLGSAQKATKVLADLNKFSIETPFTPDQVNAAGRSLLAFGFSTQKLMPTLRMVGDVSAAVGKDFNELATIYGKARTAGTLFAEDINQLTEAGIPIIEELAKVMGVGADQVKKLGSQGKIHFAELEAAFSNMTGTGGRFAGMMDKMSQSTEGLLSTIEGKLQDEMRAIGQAMLPTIRVIAEGFEPAFAKLKQTFTEIFSPLGDMLGAFGDLFKALGIGSESGNAFVDVVSAISTVFKVLLYPTKLIWEAVGFLVEQFTNFIEFSGRIIDKIGSIGSAFDLVLAPIKAVSAVWDELFGEAEETTGLSQVSMGRWSEAVKQAQKATGATTEQIWEFTKSFDASRVAGLSAADATRFVVAQLDNFVHAANGCTDASGDLIKITADLGKKVLYQAGSIGELEARLKVLQERYTNTGSALERSRLTMQMDELNRVLDRMKGKTDNAAKGLSGLMSAIKGAAMESAAAKNELAEVFKLNDAAGQPVFDANETIAKAITFGGRMKDIFKDMATSIKQSMVSIAADFAFAFGEAIASGGKIGDVFRQALRDLLVEIPKLAGMALLNAAIFPGNAPIALPLAAIGLGLLGLSGIVSGIFKKGDANRSNSIASDIPAPAVQRTQNNSLNAFGASINNDIGQQVADALDGRRIQLVLSDGKQLDAYVKDANKRNLEREGK